MSHNKYFGKKKLYIKARRIIKKCISFLLNPHLLICFGIAWMITNGWCYIFIGLGAWLSIGWMWAVGTAYASFLWIPFTPEKIVTIIISIFLLRLIFPNDTKTLAILKKEYSKVKSILKFKKNRHKERKQIKKAFKDCTKEQDTGNGREDGSKNDF